MKVQPATPPRAVSAAFCAPDGCSRAIFPSGAFLYCHCTHIGNSAGGAIAASPPEDTAELHPPEDLFFCPFASPNTFFRFFIQYKRAINGGFFPPRLPLGSPPDCTISGWPQVVRRRERCQRTPSPKVSAGMMPR